MLVLEATHILKQYGDRTILEVEEFRVYKEDRIGIVGRNGAGKTTFLNILAGRVQPDLGEIKIYGEYGYITQLETPEELETDPLLRRAFSVQGNDIRTMSGGEKTRLKIAQEFSKSAHILFADEPTSNMDIKGIRALEEQLLSFDGAILIISHDRELLNHICNKIIEVDQGKIVEYTGNYDAYKRQREMERERKQFEYESYIKEKKRLEGALIEKRQKAKSMKKTPSRMGNSEARLHKRGVNGKRGKLEAAAKSIETRIEQLEQKEKPRKALKIRIDRQEGTALRSRIAIEGEGLTKSFGSRVLFQKADFRIPNGAKVAFIGDNGTGKTTLIQMIIQKERGIRISPSVKIGYFSQGLSILDADKTILENVLEKSVLGENTVRTILARLLFSRDDIYKKIHLLSGGERVKAALAKVLVQDMNVLILDEPTNYLDIYSQEALEEMLKEYEGTILLVSHDRKLIDMVTDHVIVLENQELICYDGNYTEYEEMKKTKKENQEDKALLMQLEHRLAEVNSRLSIPSRKDDIQSLDREFRGLVEQIRSIKNLR